jgi:drug/metabolite transporter (DMT)-like permease
MTGRNDERALRHRIFAQSRAFPRGANLPILASTPKRNGDASVPGEKSARRRGVLLVLVATVLWSMAGPFARLLAHLDIWTVMGWRALLGAVSIAVVGLIEWRRGRLDNAFGFGPLSPLVALLAMIAISAYTASVMTTTIADVMVIYATLPFVAAAIGFVINGERVSPRTLAAAVVALLGIVIMVASGLGSGRVLGQALSMLMTLAFAGMIVLQRRQPKASMIVVNCLGALGSGIFGLANSPLEPIGLHDFVILFVFGLTTIGLAFVIFMEGAKFIPSAEAGLISLLDVVLGPVWVFLAFGENPGLPTMVGGAIVLAAAVWRMAPELRRERVI